MLLTDRENLLNQIRHLYADRRQIEDEIEKLKEQMEEIEMRIDTEVES